MAYILLRPHFLASASMGQDMLADNAPLVGLGAIPEQAMLASVASQLRGAVADPIPINARDHMAAAIEGQGYPMERHYVETKDGYILTMFRIPGGRRASNATEPIRARSPVLLQHALLCSSFDFVNNDPHQSLGFLLADAGFDVWLGNNRGNMWGTNHTTLNIDTDEFWDFSWDEMALFDLPANIEYVLQATGQRSLAYIGHSEGTTQAFAGFSHNQTLASKVHMFVALAPVAYVRHASSPAFNALAVARVPDLFQLFGVRQFLTLRQHLNDFAKYFCWPAPAICNTAIFLFCGVTHHIDTSRLRVYLSQTPSGTSVKNMAHWAQSLRHGDFRMYDYGSAEKNLKRYKQPKPPAYDLGSMKVKTALFTGGRDLLADKRDVEHLVEGIPTTSLHVHDDTPDYAHLDFAWASDAYQFLYPKIISILKETFDVNYV